MHVKPAALIDAHLAVNYLHQLSIRAENKHYLSDVMGCV